MKRTLAKHFCLDTFQFVCFFPDGRLPEQIKKIFLHRQNTTSLKMSSPRLLWIQLAHSDKHAVAFLFAIHEDSQVLKVRYQLAQVMEVEEGRLTEGRASSA